MGTISDGVGNFSVWVQLNKTRFLKQLKQLGTFGC